MNNIIRIGSMEEWVRQKQAELNQSEVEEYLNLEEYKVEQKVKQKKEC